MKHQPLKVSGLLSSGKIQHDPDSVALAEFGAATGKAQQLHAGPSKISLALIDDSPYQPRMQYDSAELDNLGHSLAAAGLEDPITVRATPDNRYQLIGGHRRVRAARSLGWVEIDANIVVRDDRAAELATMVQNEARVDLSDYERGKLYHAALASKFATTQSEIAHLFGTSQAHVSKRMGMLKLPNIYLTMLEAKPNLFGVNCAESINQLLKEYPGETKLIEDGVRRISEEGADQSSVKQWVQQMVKQKHSTTTQQEQSVITDKSGRPIFTARSAGRELTIRIKVSEIDTKEIEEIVLAALRQRAELAGAPVIPAE